MKSILFEIFEMLYCIIYHLILTLFGVFICVSNANIAREAFSCPGILLIIAWGILGIILIINFIQELKIVRKRFNSSNGKN